MQSSEITRRHRVLGAITVTVASALLAGWLAGMPSPELADDVGFTSGPPLAVWRRAGLALCHHHLRRPGVSALQVLFPCPQSVVDRHPQTTLLWHHLPLPSHEPVATRLAVMAECMGTFEGPAGFWRTVEWIFLNSRGNGRGLPNDVNIPSETPAVQACLTSDTPLEAVHTQTRLAAQAGIDATPTLKLVDRATGEELLLSGVVEGDALLSALDLLSVIGDRRSHPSGVLPADIAGQPR